MASYSDEYGRYCADKLYYLKKKYPFRFWAAPDEFFYGLQIIININLRWYINQLWLRFWFNAFKI